MSLAKVFQVFYKVQWKHKGRSEQRKSILSVVPKEEQKALGEVWSILKRMLIPMQRIIFFLYLPLSSFLTKAVKF